MAKRRTATARAAGLAAMLAAAGAGPSHAVVGGRTGGPRADAAVMVLNARGGVCSGIVLAPSAILTAAHCVDRDTQVRVHWRDEGNQPVLVPPAAIVIAPQPRKEGRRTVDLALLRLPSALPPGFAAAVLLDDAWPRAGETVAVAGFGLAEESDARSTGTYRSTELRVVEPYGPGKVLLWMSAGEVARGACHGDSGGPVLDGADRVVAVTAWTTGDGRRQCGRLTQGVLVRPMRAWIDGRLAEWGETPRWETK